MKDLIDQYSQLARVAKLFLTIQFLGALFFAWPIWYAFASQALTPFQIGIYFSVAAGMQLIAEVPTGAFADRFGRRRSALLGSSMLIALPLILYYGHTFPAYIIAAIISGIGYAFISGSLEALVYDHDEVSKQDYRTISWLGVTFFQSGLILSTVTGGFMYQLNHGLPFIAEALAAIISLIIIFSLDDKTRSESSIKTDELKPSYISYFMTGVGHLLATKYLRIIILMGAPLAVIMTASIEYINEAQMIEYGLAPSVRGLLLGGVKVFALIVINLILLKLLKHDRARLIFIALVGTFVFTVFSMNSLPLFFIAFIAFNWLSATQDSFIKPILQDGLPSSHRATALSAYSAITGLIAVGGNIAIGYLLQTFGTPHAVYTAFAIIFLVLIVPCTLWLAAHLKRGTSHENVELEFKVTEQ